jgi:uncharacterized membrane protein
MIRCSNCPASLNDGTAFCPFCGAQQTGTAPSGGPPPPPNPAPVPEFTSGIRLNIAAALTYPRGFITGIIFLAKEPYKYDQFVRFHAFQSIFLSLVYILFSMGWGTLVGLLFDAKLGFVFNILSPLMFLLRLALFPLGVFLMYKAFKFERFSLPIIGRMAAGLAGWVGRRFSCTARWRSHFPILEASFVRSPQIPDGA